MLGHPPDDKIPPPGGHDGAGSPVHQPGDARSRPNSDHCGTTPVWSGTLQAAVRSARLAIADHRYGRARTLLARHLGGADLSSLDVRDVIDGARTYAAATRADIRPPDNTTPSALPLQAAVRVATHLIGSGEQEALDSAAALLESYLDGLDPNTAPAVPMLIDAAARYGVVAHDRDLGLAWADYAYRASRQVCEPCDDSSGYALHVLSSTLTKRGRHEQAIGLCREHLTTAGPSAAPGPLAYLRMCLAEALHTGGHCGDGIREAVSALAGWRNTYGDRDPALAALTVRVVCMLAGCGRHEEAMICLLDGLTAFPAAGSAERRVLGARAVRAIEYAQLTHPTGCAHTDDAAHGLTPAADRHSTATRDFCRRRLAGPGDAPA